MTPQSQPETPVATAFGLGADDYTACNPREKFLLAKLFEVVEKETAADLEAQKEGNRATAENRDASIAAIQRTKEESDAAIQSRTAEFIQRNHERFGPIKQQVVGILASGSRAMQPSPLAMQPSPLAIGDTMPLNPFETPKVQGPVGKSNGFHLFFCFVSCSLANSHPRQPTTPSPPPNARLCRPVHLCKEAPSAARRC